MKETRKHTRKLLSCILAIAMVFSLAYSYDAKAAATVTVTLRLEQDGSTLAAPVTITLTDEDTKTDHGLTGLATGAVTEVASPLHALVKYMETKGATAETMSKYIAVSFTYGSAYITGISPQGKCDEAPYGSAASGSQENVYWNFAVNNAAPIDPVNHYGYASDQYILKNGDNIVFYGLWNSYPDPDETLYSYFDRSSYAVFTNTPLNITLAGSGMAYDENYNSTNYTKAISNATVMASEYKDADSCATEENAVITAIIGADGKASLTFTKEGVYVLSAFRKTADGSHIDISRPYAIVTVGVPENPGQKPGTSVTDPGTSKPDTPIAKPGKVKKVTATVKNSRKKKKTVTVTWKKVSGATGYKVYLSKKKNKSYRKKTTVKKTKAVLKLKKGTYYIKVRAYTKSGTTIRSGAMSKPLKVFVLVPHQQKLR